MSSSFSEILNHGESGREDEEIRREKKERTGFLTLHDLIAWNVDLNDNVSKLEALLMTAEVASVKLEEQERMKKMKGQISIFPIQGNGFSKSISRRDLGTGSLPKTYNKYDSSLRIKAKEAMNQKKKNVIPKQIYHCSCSGKDILGNQEIRKSYEMGSCGIKNSSRFRDRTLPEPPPDLPEKFKNKIAELNGNKAKLVIQKVITPTDENNSQSRLTVSKVNKLCDFLTEEETELLDRGANVRLKIIEPNLDISDCIFKQWKNGNGKQYAFTTYWNEIRRRNRIVASDIIQVWSFRVKGDLFFAFVRL